MTIMFVYFKINLEILFNLKYFHLYVSFERTKRVMNLFIVWPAHKTQIHYFLNSFLWLTISYKNDGANEFLKYIV